MVSVVVLLVLSAVLGPTTALDEPSAVRKFSLVTKNGENVLHKDFDRQRLTDGLDHLSLAFRAANLDVSEKQTILPCSDFCDIYLSPPLGH